MSGPSLLLRGGRIRASFDGAVHESLGIRDGRVVAVGDDSAVGSALGASDTTIDLDGAWVVPGLIDTHPHLLHFALAGSGLADLSNVTTHREIVDAIAQLAAHTPLGAWVMATPVGEAHYFFRRGYRQLAEGDLPDRFTLDRATAGHPVMIQAWSPSLPNTCAFNSMALAALGIDLTTPERVGNVWIEKDVSGHPTGRLRGAVTSNYNPDPFFREILTRLPTPAGQSASLALRSAIRDAHRQGVTAICENHAIEARHIDVYRRLLVTGELTMRVKAVPEYQRSTRPSDLPKSMGELAATLAQALAAVDLSGEWLRIEGITVSTAATCASGSMPWHTDYPDAFGNLSKGSWVVSAEAIDQAVEFCSTSGLQLNVCAIGPPEHDVFLDAIERHGVRDGVLQHGLLMSEEQARRWAAAGFRQTVCCGFTWGKSDVYARAFGDRVLTDLNPLRRLLDVGLTLGASTDWGPRNPWEQMWLAETHLVGRTGQRNDGEAQVVTRAEALGMWTGGGAAVLNWPELGSLHPGAHADLAVVDRDPLTCDLDDLPATAVLSTITGGRTVWSAEQ